MSADPSIQSLVVMCRRLDELHGGAALRNWQNVQGLARLGPVDVVSVGPEDHPSSVPGVRHFEGFSRVADDRIGSMSRKSWVLSGHAHPMLNTHYRPRIGEWIRRRMSEVDYDLVVVEELPLARYLEDVAGRARFTVFDAHNVESALYRDIGASASQQGRGFDRWRRGFLDRRLAAAERWYAGRCDRVWTCSELDRNGFNGLLEGRVPVDVIPNSIDVSRYSQPDRVPESGDWSNLPLTLVYLGSYNYRPNEEAALTLIQGVLPILARDGVEARLLLIGAGATDAMKRAASGDSRVRITGKVDSVMPFLREPCLVTLPLTLGSGTRLKILEAFAASRPVISSAKGVEGIDALDGRHLLIRETAEEFARAAVSLWTDSGLRARLCGNALALVEEHYSIDSAAGLIRNSLSAAGLIPATREGAPESLMTL